MPAAPGHGRKRASFVAVAVLALGLGVASPAAGQGATLTVTPSQGLLDGTTVQVEATSAPTPFAVVAVCDVNAPTTTIEAAAAWCGQATLLTDVSGASFSFDIDQQFGSALGNRPIDCLVDDCMVVYATSDTLLGAVTDFATVPIGFVEPPSVVVEPASGLRDGDAVTISVLDLTDETSAQPVQCTPTGPGPIPPEQCIDLGEPVPIGDPVGFSLGADVQQMLPFTAFGLPFDCGVIGCQVGVRLTGGVAPGIHAAVVGFAPTLEVDPFGDLVREQPLDVQVRSAGAASVAYVGTCPPGVANATIAEIAEQCAGTTHPLGGSDLSSTLIADRFVVPGGGGPAVDCVVDRFCEVVAVTAVDTTGSPIQLARQRLSYRRSETWSLAPGTPVADGASLTIETYGSPTTPTGSGAFVMQCGAVFDPTFRFFCSNVGDVETDFDGQFLGSLSVRAQFAGHDGTIVDCRIPKRCAAAFVIVDPRPRVVYVSALGLTVTDAAVR